MVVEEHPLEPFLPGNARVLFLGSFPPPRARWSMEFFYPNWINDFWRIQGLIHFGDAHHFEVPSGSPAQGDAAGCGVVVHAVPTDAKRFDRDRIVEFCRNEGLAFFDTARKVCRMKGNADDNFLEVVERTDVFALLRQMPLCRTIVTTGGKASEELQAYFAEQGIAVEIPKVGERVELAHQDISWWRMPSTSRAYPMKMERKAEYYMRLVLKVDTI